MAAQVFAVAPSTAEIMVCTVNLRPVFHVGVAASVAFDLNFFICVFSVAFSAAKVFPRRYFGRVSFETVAAIGAL